MVDYTFTVRATDNLGAYADRQFTATVNNTQVANFIATGTTGAAYSMDGITWTDIPEIAGCRYAEYGNGKWWATRADGSTTPSLYSSEDGANWTAHNVAIPSGLIHYDSTLGWWLVHYDSGLAGYWPDPSAATAWQFSIGSSSAAYEGQGIAKINNLWMVACASSGLKVNSGTLTNNLDWRDPSGTKPTAMNTSYRSGFVKVYNNVAYCGGFSTGTWRSIDGENWGRISSLPIENELMDIIYAEGTLLAHNYNNAGDFTLYKSVDSGLTWSQVTVTNNSASVMKNHPSQLRTLSYSNGVLVHATNTDSILHYSTDLGETWDVINLPSSIGGNAGVYSRFPNDSQ